MPLFTPETAAINGRIGALVRWSKPSAPPEPEPTLPAPAILPAPAPTFQSRRLIRVQAQLERIDEMLLKEKDSKTLKELADASARLSVQEFALAGRPLPGTKRPAPDGARRSRSDTSMLLEDMPVAQVVPSVPARPLGWEYDDPSSVTPPADVTP